MEAVNLALTGCFLTAVSSRRAHLAPSHKVTTQSLRLPDPVWLRRYVSLWGWGELGRDSLPTGLTTGAAGTPSSEASAHLWAIGPKHLSPS